ncbi:MAG: hypothetical protein WDM81_21295 [Rhizomicrobium sp.]
MGRVSVKFLPYIDLTDRIDIDRANGTLRRHEVYLTGIFGRTSLQVSYVQLPAEVATPGAGPARGNQRPGRRQFLRELAGLRRPAPRPSPGPDARYRARPGYEDECLGISVAYRRKFTTDRDVPPSTSIILRFNLKTGDQAIEPFSLFPQDVFSHP